MSASHRSLACSLAAMTLSALLGSVAPLAAQDTTPPTDRPAETPPQSETAPPPEAPAARPDVAGATPVPEGSATAAPADAPETPPERPDEAAQAPADAAPAADAADAPSSGEPQSEDPPAEGPTARPETADDPPPLPASLAGVPEPVIALHVSTTFCEDPSGPALADHAALVTPLGPTAVLVGIPCTGDSARAAFRLYVLETGEIGGVHAQFFALPSKTLGWTGTEVLWQPSTDAEGRLTGTLYDPGEGRCASRGRWRWNGYALAMETAELEASCGKGDWRSVYP
ncbi:hypothetical protein RUR49_04085 [Pseudoxanthobacter sp. M-2]|uniref:hypothetical protein n=1 Tax=Pseudoxanthobacter sp. M-2 TaxID=3078754 RepID=UPI0038FC39D2